uniref:Uncharacterized protein n=1 Tax=Sphaerodactylus townsendi TaxID=933632 RepID=A0ACB8FNR2_9SAUR
MVFAERKETISGGNFHGEYPAKHLGAVVEIVEESRSRIWLLVGVDGSEEWWQRSRPAHDLVAETESRAGSSGGRQGWWQSSGAAKGPVVAYTASPVCTATPGVAPQVYHHSSTPISPELKFVATMVAAAATEDHVSMGGWAARKALKVIENVEQVLAIELLAACQGIEFLRPLKTTTPLEKVYDLVRSVVKPWLRDRFMAPDIAAAHGLLVDQKASTGTSN